MSRIQFGRIWGQSSLMLFQKLTKRKPRNIWKHLTAIWSLTKALFTIQMKACCGLQCIWIWQKNKRFKDYLFRIAFKRALSAAWSAAVFAKNCSQGQLAQLTLNQWVGV